MPYMKRRARKKVCYFTKNKFKFIDYKDIETLQKFIGANGKISPRRLTGTSARFKGN
jgi:small subunit ribosomal protein S18